MPYHVFLQHIEIERPEYQFDAFRKAMFGSLYKKMPDLSVKVGKMFTSFQRKLQEAKK